MLKLFIDSTPLYVIFPVGVLLSLGILYLEQQAVDLLESTLVGNIILNGMAIGMVAFVFYIFLDLGIF